MPKLFVKKGALAGKTFSLTSEVTMGRLSSCDITIHDEQLSRRHTKIFPQGEQFFVEDMKSRNGTYLNGQKIKKQPLKKGDVIAIGNNEFIFDAQKAAAGEAPTDLTGKNIAGFDLKSKEFSSLLCDNYQAHQASLDRVVTLKVFQPKYGSQKALADKFLQAAKEAGKINHAHIVATFDVGREKNLTFICQEVLSGVTFEDLLQAGQIELDQVLDMMRGVAAALEFIHENGQVHGGISTRTVFFTTEGEAKLFDLAITPPAMRLKLSGEPAVYWSRYTSPEVAQKKDPSPSSDVYSLGVVLFEICTGRPPFVGTSAKEIKGQHVNQAAPKASAIDGRTPQEVEDLIREMLAKRPQDRPTARDVAERLETIYQNLYGSAVALEATRPIAEESAEVHRKSGRVARTLPSQNFTPVELGVFAIFLVILFFLSSGVTKLFFTLLAGE